MEEEYATLLMTNENLLAENAQLEADKSELLEALDGERPYSIMQLAALGCAQLQKTPDNSRAVNRLKTVRALIAKHGGE